MDMLDEKIISELLIHGFRKSHVLEPTIGVTERTISRRINRLKSDNLIKTVAVPNPFLLGIGAWAKIGVKVEPRFLHYVAHQLVDHPSTYSVMYTLGAFDIIASVQFDSIDGLTTFINSDLVNINGLISSETMMLVNPRKYYSFSWTRSENAARKENLYKIDDIDKEIINMLTADAFTHPRILKLKLKIGESTIRRRIKGMLMHGAYKIEVLVNPRILKNYVSTTLGIKTSRVPPDEVIDTLIKNPAVYLATASTGRFNILVSARFPHLDMLSDFLNVELPRIKGVDSVESFLHNRPLKFYNIDWANTGG
jgi:DNA-binding Lrp family transcriptional regulator